MHGVPSFDVLLVAGSNGMLGTLSPALNSRNDDVAQVSIRSPCMTEPALKHHLFMSQSPPTARERVVLFP